MPSKRITIGDPLTPLQQNRLRAALKLRIIHEFEAKLGAANVPPPIDGSTVEMTLSVTLSPDVVRECAEEAGVKLQSTQVVEEDVPPVNRENKVTLHGTPIEEITERHAAQPTGQHDDYVVLSEDERSKGFVRPVRRGYKHVGTAGPKYALRDLDAGEHKRYDQYKYVKFEEYPADHHLKGRYWTQEQLDKVGKGCGTITTMGVALAETYARDPQFYGATFCCGCNTHLPVGEGGEFIWEGTNERVGT